MSKRTVLLLALLGASCSGNSSPTAPTTPVVPACQTNRTGTITATNNGARTVDVLWSGAVIATLNPGQTSAQRTVVAGGAQYLLDFIITNTQIHPCTTLVATPLQCTNNPYGTCSGF